jgi:saccharopine dehydrogenase-like NADP-dependent oxidoreductase
MNRPIMIVGATGVFGSRLLGQLVQAGFSSFILAGRNEKSAKGQLEALAKQNINAIFLKFDRGNPHLETLKKLAPRIIIDAAGPFQNSSLILPEAAIAAKINYIDLADARDFVARISTLNDKAKAAGVAVISGASTTPAISHAVLDHLTQDWQRIDEILVAIVPGNRAPRGLSVIKAILRGVGEPVSVFTKGRQTKLHGWSLNEKIEIPGVGCRYVALCETPDLDLLVSRFHPRISAEFKAGLELGIMHNTLRVLSYLRARKLIPNIAPLARPIQKAAQLLYPYGTDLGGMMVRVSGQNQNGTPTKATWSLVAIGGVGPNIPCLAALILCKQQQLKHGAYAAAGLINYGDITSEFNRLNITYETLVEEYVDPQVFQRALCAKAFDRLPAITQFVHTLNPSVKLSGRAHIEGAETWAGQLTAKLFAFPKSDPDAVLQVVITRGQNGENWQRHYPDRTMHSVISLVDESKNLIEERFGSFRFQMKLVSDENGLDMKMQSGSFMGVRIPIFLMPTISATERVSPNGKHLFDVHISHPLVGRLVHYKGWLEPVI